MNWRQGVFFAMVAIGLLLAGRAVWQRRDTLLINKALYEANQGHADRARRQLERANPLTVSGKARQARLAARLALADGKPNEAMAMLAGIDTPGARFDRGIALYLAGREPDAVEEFRGALADTAQLSDDETYLSRLALAAMAQETAPTGPAPSLPIRQPHRQLFLAAMTGRLHVSSGAWERAAGELSEAIALGDQTTATRVAAVAAHGMTGQFADAARLGDPFIQDNDFLTQLLALTDSETTASAGHLAMDESVRASSRFTAAMRLTAWANLRHSTAIGDREAITRAHKVIQEVQARQPDSAFLQMLNAEACEALGQYREAYEIYEEITAHTPSLSGLVRARELAGRAGTTGTAILDYLTSAQAVHVSPTTDLYSTAARLIDGIPTLTTSGTIETTVTVPVEGNYRLAIVAAGHPSAGVGPEIRLLLNGHQFADIYIARHGRDCYSIPVKLKSGPTIVGLEYSNDTAAPLNPAEDRLVAVEMIAVLPAESR